MVLDETSIISNSIPIKPPVIPGVYFLINIHDQIIYIGSSEDLHTRMNCHRGNFNLIFNRWTYIVRKDKEDRRALEVEYIRKFKPRFNIKDNPIAEHELRLALTYLGEEEVKLLSKNDAKLSRKRVERILLDNDIEPQVMSHHPITKSFIEARKLKRERTLIRSKRK